MLFCPPVFICFDATGQKGIVEIVSSIKGGIFMANIKFEIKETFGVVSDGPKGWKKELNLISWNDCEPKYDKGLGSGA